MKHYLTSRYALIRLQKMITITEALSEINLIKKKVTGKRAQIQQMLIRATHIPDVYEKEGGSKAFIEREMQAIADLNLRLIRIRSEISHANLETQITLSEGAFTLTQSIHDWLIWKRELVKEQLQFVNSVNTTVKLHIDSVSKQPQVYKDEEGNIHLVKSEVNIHYPSWVAQQASLNALFEKLDGQLSLKNATVTIDA
jgi:hypothetical protein